RRKGCEQQQDRRCPSAGGVRGAQGEPHVFSEVCGAHGKRSGAYGSCSSWSESSVTRTRELSGTSLKVCTRPETGQVMRSSAMRVASPSPSSCRRGVPPKLDTLPTARCSSRGPCGV